MADQAIWVLCTDQKKQNFLVNTIGVNQVIAAWERAAVLARAEVETTTAPRSFGRVFTMQNLNYAWKELKNPGTRSAGVVQEIGQMLTADGTVAQTILASRRQETRNYLKEWQQKLETAHKVNAQFLKDMAGAETDIALAKGVRDAATSALIICATGGAASGAISAGAAAGVGWGTVAVKTGFEYSESHDVGKAGAILVVEGASFVLGGIFAEATKDMGKVAKVVGFLCLKAPFEACKSAVTGDNFAQSLVGIAGEGVGTAAEMMGLLGEFTVAVGKATIVPVTKEMVKNVLGAVGIDVSKSVFKEFFKTETARADIPINLWKAFLNSAAATSDRGFVNEYCIRSC
jgi:hypothetical protein